MKRREKRGVEGSGEGRKGEEIKRGDIEERKDKSKNRERIE